MSGIVTSQVFQYHVNFPNDRSVYKSIVYGLLVLDLTHTAINVWASADIFFSPRPPAVPASDAVEP